MPDNRWRDQQSDDWEEREDDDRYDEDDLDSEYDDDAFDDDAPELVDCPECGEPVYEDAEQCPSCGQYITHSTSPLAGKPGWMIGLFVAGVLAVILSLMMVF
jgi:hypothetical protein